MIKRIIDSNGLFLRDDFEANDGEIALDVAPAQGFYLPKWDFVTEIWVEGATQEYIDNLLAVQVPSEPSTEERLATVESTQTKVVDTLAVALGVVIE